MKAIEQIKDYKEAAEILNAEYASLNWHGTKCYGGNLMRDDEGWNHFAWQMAFAPPCKQIQFFEWKSGTGHAHKKGMLEGRGISPNPAEVLARCCADYISSANASFADWAGEFGYDEDSRKAFCIYETCQEIGPKLKKLGLTREQIQRFADLSNML